MPSALRILALATYPELGASTRYRVLQYAPLLAAHQIALDVRPFLTDATFAGLYDRSRALRTAGGIVAGLGRRGADAFRLGAYDLIFVQREAALVGPPLVEWLGHRRRPLVLDLDDATYLERPSDVFGGLARVLKWPGKTARLIRWADHVTCGNPAIAAHVSRQRVPTTVIPTIVDVDRWVPGPARESGDLVLGWIGTHSTFVYFKTLLPVFERLAAAHRFRLRVVGSGARELTAAGLAVELRPWRLERELHDLQSFDIAVYPMVQEEWAEGKSGFKAVQYLSCGIPYVASPVGVVAQMGVPGETHLEARTEDEWFAALSRLLADAELRQRLSRRGREYALATFSIRESAATLARVFRETIAARQQRAGPRS